jgi:hypothetical protein
MATADNPFAVKTPAQLQQDAAAGTMQAGATGYDATNVNATGYDAVGQKSSGYDAAQTKATGYNANTATGTNYDVTKQQTVQGQLEGVIAADSPLMQQARAQSLAQMNRRGLINSSMAVGAGQEAVIKQALPIAQADAATYGAAAKYSADTANAMAQFNTNLQNKASEFGANAENVIAAANTAAKNEAAKFGATAENVAAASNQAAINEASKFGASAENTAALANAASQNEAAKFEATAQNISASDFAKNVNANVATMMDQSMKIALSNADSATKIELQNIDAQTRKDLAATEATYKNAMQASASANEIFQQATKNIADIMSNPDLSSYATTDNKTPTEDKKNWPAGATKLVNGKLYDANNKEIVSPKQAAVDTQKAYLQGSLTILSATSGIPGLKELISF